MHGAPAILLYYELQIIHCNNTMILVPCVKGLSGFQRPPLRSDTAKVRDKANMVSNHSLLFL